ncbi:MAG: transcriptional repressor LexA [Eubacteriales bacterium]|nr:transcriptional repressor LexA [Eubacteriales bacterium]MDY3332752.1 transcriptional repressor LexA [Gallibacter sp.]
MSQLKERTKKVFLYIRDMTSKRGYPPTVREIMNALDIKSTSTVHADLRALEEAEYIKRDPSKTRAIIIVDKHDSDNSNELSWDADTTHSVVNVPVVGDIAAGTPILASENVEDLFPLPARFVNGNTNFMLNVKGESMIEVGIMDGDYILVEQQQVANNGDIVVAMINDSMEPEATVKTFYKEKGYIRLQPENSSMEPIIVNDVTILGKVKGVFRYL